LAGRRGGRARGQAREVAAACMLCLGGWIDHECSQAGPHASHPSTSLSYPPSFPPIPIPHRLRPALTDERDSPPDHRSSHPCPVSLFGRSPESANEHAARWQGRSVELHPPELEPCLDEFRVSHGGPSSEGTERLCCVVLGGASSDFSPRQRRIVRPNLHSLFDLFIVNSLQK